MKSLDIFLSQIFISLENFLQKTTTLNIFEALIFNYKIKVNSEEEFSPQFIAFVVDLCNELQLILRDNVTTEAEKLDVSDKPESIFSHIQSENPGFEVVEYAGTLPPEQIPAQPEKEIWDQGKIQEGLTTQEENHVGIEEMPPSSPVNEDKQKIIYTCDFCNRKYRTSEKLSKHLCKSAPINDRDEESVDNPDSIATDQFGLRELSSHPEASAELPVFVCAVCFSAFSQRELFDQHTHTDSSQDVELVTASSQLQSQRKFTCGVCCEVYRSLARISYHVARCHAGPYHCELCPHVVATKQLLNHHKKKSHKGVESFFCAECGLGFKLRTSLQKHMVKRHESEQDYFRCQEDGCGQIFSKKIQLTNHRIAVHGVERKFLCQVCGHKFMTQDSLSSHLESHNNSWRFQCRFCEKLFNTKEKMTFHVRTHTGEKPYACDRPNCQKSFISKTKLSEHLQRHRGEKRHKCTVCGKQYANKPDLRVHLRKIHPQEDGTPKPPEEVGVGVDQQGMELFPCQVVLQVDHPSSTPSTANQMFNNVHYYQEPVHVVRTVTLPIITSYEPVISI